MNDILLPAGFAVLVWWFTTGIILFLDGLPQRTFRWSMGVATAGLVAAAYVLDTSSRDLSVSGAYAAFASAIAVWGWLEMSFLMGFVTGSRRTTCLDGCGGWRHFVHATQAIIYNELATLTAAVCTAVITWHSPNRVALWTFSVLWAMRLSAKLNLFLGVPNLGEKFLPPHLQYLKNFFRRRPMNFLFPLSITAATIVIVLLGQKLLAAPTAFDTTACSLTISLLALAVLEHWFMVLPLPSERMWRWAMRPDRVTVAQLDT